MKLQFKHISRSRWVPDEGRLVVYLQGDNWDDFSFKTLYALTVFDDKGNKHKIGGIKIGYFGQKSGTKTDIPQSFRRLEDKYFSLGQGSEYYQNINKLNDEIKVEILNRLNDVVQNQGLLERAIEEEVTKTSLLRSISISSINGQFKRLLEGGSLLTNYNFYYDMPQGRKTAGLKLEFSVDPESHPPTNIHVLIGRNGVGKTHLLNDMVKALVQDEETALIDSNSQFSVLPDIWEQQSNEDLFAGVVSVAFSAFDPFEPYPEKKDKTKGMRYSYVGLKRSSNRGGKRGTPMSHEMLTNEFVKSLKACVSQGKLERWSIAINNLESDPLFREISLSDVVSSCDPDELEDVCRSLYKKMSSGHGIVLLTITKLVEKVEEKTLVLIDEPEGHLHPPLLSAFIRALSDLLTHRNGVAIIATHSPVIVQEVPKNCVWKIRRTGLEANSERPEIETFGENVGILTREIFGLEVTESGYHRLLKEAQENQDSFQSVVQYFGNNLGSEARGILRGLIAEQHQEEQ
ncbi:MAG: AAA family ATPase [Candidatus Brocadiales bacterium]|nr:AAA family ATPase [Candidatus Brocadiales bacterium]